MSVLIGLLLHIGLVYKPRLSMYWSTDELYFTPIFSAVMSRDRFLIFMHFLHFADNSCCDVSDPARDGLHKIRPVIDLTFADLKKALPNDNDRKLIINTEVLFRRLLGVACSRDVDLKNVLRHELVAIPPVLFNYDGRMTKTNKADLAQKLESNCEDVVASLPQAPDATSSAYITDWMACLQSLNENHFRTFNDLAEVVQNGIVCCKILH